MKRVETVHAAPGGHWVGDGFPVRSLFSYDRMGAENVTPFLLLDHAGPYDFPPAQRRRGVGQHPHRGFETVTLVYEGELEHRDSTGSGGRIGPGDVQWMTAGAGIVHEEYHSAGFTRSGGRLEMVQLWVNLPARHKSAPAAYQTLHAADIPEVALEGGGGVVRVVAGDCLGHRGPARTFTPVNVWDVRLDAGDDTVLPAPAGHGTLLVVLEGSVRVNGEEAARTDEVVRLGRDEAGVRVQAREDTRLLLLSGEPIDEPVAGYGPFVMNTHQEIRQAFVEFSSGRYGRLSG